MRAYEYLSILEERPDMTYHDLAERSNVSKARISQMIALTSKLPEEILDYLIDEDRPEYLRFFTERKLRPLTVMKSDNDKIAKFEEMKERLVARQAQRNR